MRTPHLLLLTITLLLLAAIPASADTILVDNGPVNGNIGGSLINFGYSTADSFDLSTTEMITGFIFGTWTLPNNNVSDIPQTVDWQITADDPFGLNVVAGVAAVDLTSTYLYTNTQGFDIYSNYFQITNVSLPAGEYWFQLGNAITNQSGIVLWDVNNGPADAFLFDGATASSLAYTDPLTGEDYSGSESFQILTPEPGTMALLGSGLLLAGFFRRKKSR